MQMNVIQIFGVCLNRKFQMNLISVKKRNLIYRFVLEKMHWANKKKQKPSERVRYQFFESHLISIWHEIIHEISYTHFHPYPQMYTIHFNCNRIR